MALSVSDALRRAAERAQRCAELEVARDVIERSLGHQLADDEFGWFGVLSMPYFVYIYIHTHTTALWYQNSLGW